MDKDFSFCCGSALNQDITDIEEKNNSDGGVTDNDDGEHDHDSIVNTTDVGSDGLPPRSVSCWDGNIAPIALFLQPFTFIRISMILSCLLVCLCARSFLTHLFY